MHDTERSVQYIAEISFKIAKITRDWSNEKTNKQTNTQRCKNGCTHRFGR